MRKAAGLSQEQLGKLVKVYKGTISRWESGERPIDAAREDHIRLRLAIHKESAA